MTDIHICKIPLENLHGEYIPVYSTWTGTSFSVNIFHKDKAWNKFVSEDELKSLCSFTQNSVEEYLIESKRALTCDDGCTEFTYSLIKSEFILKKIVDNVHNIKVKFGSFLLEEVPVSSFAEKAVDFLINDCLTLKAKNNSLRKENDDLRTANTSLRTHVCGITKLKTEMEEALCTKSLAVLNAKKEKICELQQIIETCPTTSEIAADSGQKAEGVEVSPSKLRDLYGSETELDTDENSDDNCPKRSSTQCRVKEEDKELLPTASKSQKLEHLSNSLTLGYLTKGPKDNEDDDANIFVPARRKKNIKSGVPR